MKISRKNNVETLIEIVIVLILIIQSHAQSARDHVCWFWSKKNATERNLKCATYIFSLNCRLLGWLQEWSTKKWEKNGTKKITKMSHMRMDKVNSTFASPSLLVLCFMCSFFDDLNRYFFCDLSGILFQCQLFKLPFFETGLYGRSYQCCYFKDSLGLGIIWTVVKRNRKLINGLLKFKSK